MGQGSLVDRPEDDWTLEGTHCHFNKPLLTYSCLPQTVVSMKLKQDVNNPSTGYWTAGKMGNMD